MTKKTFSPHSSVFLPFFLLVLVVFVIHATHRAEHFQDCDSTQVYDALHNFPAASLSFNSYISNGSFISTERARAILTWTPVKTLESFYRERYHVTDEAEFDARVMRALTRLNPVTAFRAATVVVVSQIPAPFFVKSFFALPTATTYSPGAGFLFGLLASAETSYDSFMSRALFLTLLLYAFSAFMLYAISRRAGASPLVGAITGTVFLFSISMYSFAYHLGSTIFNIASGFVWIWTLLRCWHTPSLLKKISLATAILMFFNYLIAVYWLAFACFYIYEEARRSIPISAKSIWNTCVAFFKTQKLTIFAFVLVGLLFYPPGQSFRGVFSFTSIPSYAYYIVLNFFGFYNHSPALNILQFALGALLILTALRNIFFEKHEAASPRFALNRLSIALLCIYAILVAAQVLAFYPSRHILVFAAPVFILAAMALQGIADRLRVPNVLLFIIWGALIVFGLLSLFPRIADVKDRFVTHTVPSDVQKVFIFDCSVSVGYKDWHAGVPVEAIKPASFAPEANRTYLYLSQISSARAAFDAITKERLHTRGTPAMRIISESYAPSETCFIGFHPAGTCLYGSPNQLYQATFTASP